MTVGLLVAAPSYSPRVQNARMGLVVQLTTSVCKWKCVVAATGDVVRLAPR
jgi:hypothetical protein